MPEIGAIIEQMDALRATFNRESATVAALTDSISSQVNNTHWVGPAAERFRGTWEGEFRPMLARLQAELDQCSAEVASRAQRIEAAGS
jgi:WXG100 family type VII secretion target